MDQEDRRAMEGYFRRYAKMITKEDVLARILQNRHYLKEHFHIKRIGLFGSFVHDEQTEESDIDIILELEDNTPGIYELKEVLRAFFGEQFQREVDIAREKYLKSYVKAQIINEAVYVE
jgi:predicted nucleotidyltransferase